MRCGGALRGVGRVESSPLGKDPPKCEVPESAATRGDIRPIVYLDVDLSTNNVVRRTDGPDGRRLRGDPQSM